MAEGGSHWVVAVWAMAAVVSGSVFGCASEESIRRPVPKEIVITPEEGVYRLVYEEGKTTPPETVPENVPVVTIWQGQRYDGLLAVRGSRARNTLVSYRAPVSPSAKIMVPAVIVPKGRRWELKVENFYFAAPDFLDDRVPLKMGVPIDPPGPEGVTWSSRVGYQGRLFTR